VVLATPPFSLDTAIIFIMVTFFLYLSGGGVIF
jgi:hypothetical protein